jgi:alpha-1,3-rhamnosyltransferase
MTRNTNTATDLSPALETTGETNAETPTFNSDVSVVVPSYNHAAYIERCLRSIINGTHAPLELIVIDDGSQDASIEIIERVLQSCPFPCELITRTRKGLCATLNEGLAHARGKYFAYLGSDDVWLPRFLAERVALLDSRPRAVLAYGHVYVIDEADRVIECTLDWARYADGDAREMLLQRIAPASPSVVYRRDALLACQGWNEAAQLEDYDLYLRLSAAGDFAFDSQILAAWRRHTSNTSHDLALMMRESLASQRQLAPLLNIGADELAAMHAALRWRYAEDFMRRGSKAEAVKLMSRNLRGASSLAAIARMLLRLPVPHRVVRWRREVVQERTHQRYGSIQN